MQIVIGILSLCPRDLLWLMSSFCKGLTTQQRLLFGFEYIPGRLQRGWWTTISELKAIISFLPFHFYAQRQSIKMYFCTEPSSKHMVLYDQAEKDQPALFSLFHNNCLSLLASLNASLNRINFCFMCLVNCVKM